MARSSRQSKILELISMFEIETQDELVSRLRAADYDITQATISRDIKELGLIKILSQESGKYKYSIVETNEGVVSNKNIIIFKESVISVKVAQNLCIIKTIKGMASAICGLIDKFNLDSLMGAVNGDDTIMVIFPNFELAKKATEALLKLTTNA
ncbi:MAG: arginine repressor [Christensenellales bacterium]